jgi:DNA (cytosine-5)-methyltransferase 1
MQVSYGKPVRGRPVKTINIVDLFSGGGGWSTGAKQACKEKGYVEKIIGLNHNPVAINTYNINHPLHLGLEAELFETDPALIQLTEVDFLIASPTCTHFSVALGGKPRSEQLRSQPDIVTRWMKVHRPKYMLMENVSEFRKWGPLYKRGPKKDRVIPHKKGIFFRKWVKEVEALGYTIKDTDLVAADFGDPTTRKRLFLVATRHDMPEFEFPEPTHTKEDWIPARDIIDWSLEGKSIFRRKKPLSQKTLDRIWKGLQKYCKDEFKPFLTMMYGTSNSVDIENPLPTVTAESVHHYLAEPCILETAFPGERNPDSVDDPLKTQTAQQSKALAEFLINISHTKAKPEHSIRDAEKPMPTQTTQEEFAMCESHLIHYYGGEGAEDRSSGVDDPIHTITAGGNRFALSQAFLLGQQSGAAPRGVDEPVPTVSTAGAISVSAPFIVKFYGTATTADPDNPLPTVTCKDRFGVVHTFGLDVRFRMLQPHELAAAMSFPKDYVFEGSKKDQVRMIGNAVAVKTAKNMVLAALHAYDKRELTLV